MVKRFSSTVAGGAIIITVVGLLGRGLGVIRESIFANYYGLSNSFDLYLIATVFPITINSIILYFAQNYFIPRYHYLKNKSEDESKQFVSASFWLFTFLGILTAVILFVFSEIIISSYLQNENPINVGIALKIFRIFLFTIPAGFSISILSSILQSQYQFKSPSISQLYLNLSIIIVVIFFSDQIGIFAIAFGYLAGISIQLFYLIKKVNNIIDLNFKLVSKRYIVSLFDKRLLIILLIEASGQVFLVADRYFFDDVDAGGIASLNYAYHIYLLPVTIFAISLATAIFPKLSDLSNIDSSTELRRSMKSFFSINVFLFVPIAFILFAYGDVIIKILFERGRFSYEDTQITYTTLQFYTISLLFFSLYAGLNKLIFSFGFIKELFIISMFITLLKITFNYLFVIELKQYGLALSTSVSYFILFAGSYIILLRRQVLNNQIEFMKILFLNLTNGLLSYFVCDLLFSVVNWHGLISEVMQIICFIFIFIYNSKLMKLSDLDIIINSLRNIPIVEKYSKV
jgi:putative peptidoglycan lipid II flippase